ncbi:CAP domain-containing protein [Roseobacter weihaiensis]|uniref:CAP domain-containing protein n=1 Tax=Roseobacter weihaiensis TaxID=2763262 RepID=UPI001D0BE1F2|nr:CAP domain-containing protein [Roseobacter sp. H9]
MSRASDLEQQMLELINEERTSQGLNTVALEVRLNESSEDHSQWMLDQDQFSHTGVNGSSAGDRMRDADFDFEGAWSWGENIAYQSERGAPGLSDDVVDLHNSLMDSPGHRANILNPDYEVIGLGIEVGDFDGFEAVMVTQNFASTDGEVQLDQEGPMAPDADTEMPAEDPDLLAEISEEPVAGSPNDPQTEGDTVPDTPQTDPETPADTGPEESPFAQLQALLAGFEASLVDDTLVFNWEDDEGENQTATFDVDAFFAEFMTPPESEAGKDQTEDDLVFPQEQAADEGEPGFVLIDAWDTIA